MGKKRLSQNIQDWVEARKRFQLSHAHVQMARELGMNPTKLGRRDNHDQELGRRHCRKEIRPGAAGGRDVR